MNQTLSEISECPTKGSPTHGQDGRVILLDDPWADRMSDGQGKKRAKEGKTTVAWLLGVKVKTDFKKVESTPTLK